MKLAFSIDYCYNLFSTHDSINNLLYNQFCFLSKNATNGRVFYLQWVLYFLVRNSLSTALLRGVIPDGEGSMYHDVAPHEWLGVVGHI